MPSILIVDSDPEFRNTLHEGLDRLGQEILEAEDVSEAVLWAKTGVVDLVICETRPTHGRAVALRAELARVLAPYPVPFIFLSDDPKGDAGIIDALTEDTYVFLFRKPPAATSIAWAASLLLGRSRLHHGEFGGDDDSFGALLGEVADLKESGVLTAYRGAIVKKVVFTDGGVSFVASNDPREMLGQWLINTGLVDDEMLEKALKRQAASAEPLGKALQAISSVTSEQIEETLEYKFRESLLDLFLWDEGDWTYAGGTATNMEVGPVFIDLAPVRREGKRRIERWAQLQAIFAGRQAVLEVDPDSFPDGFPSRPSDRRLIRLASEGRTINEIVLEARTLEFKVLDRYAELIEMGVVHRVEPGEPAKEPTPMPTLTGGEVRTLLTAATQALAAGEFDDARRACMSVLSVAPRNALARRCLAQIDKLSSERAESEGLIGDREVELAVGMSKILSANVLERVPAAHAFVLQRIAEGTTVLRELVRACPMPPAEVVEVLRIYLKRGVIKMKEK